MSTNITSPKDISEFIKDGYIIKKGLVSSFLIENLLCEIMATEFGYQDKNYGKLRKDKRFDALDEMPNILKKLYNEIILPLSIEFLQNDHILSDAQLSVIESGRIGTKDWHIDGTWIAKEQNSFKGIPFFKLLIGVYLSDLSKDQLGNFMVSPGGHKNVMNFFKDCDQESMNDPCTIFKKLYNEKIPNLIPLLMQPGDIIIAHALLPHSIDNNWGPDRPVLYFRCGEYKISGRAALSDLWHERPSFFKSINHN